jgi:hypothetical protein
MQLWMDMLTACANLERSQYATLGSWEEVDTKSAGPYQTAIPSTPAVGHVQGIFSKRFKGNGG